MKSRQKLIAELKELRSSIKSEQTKAPIKGRQKIFINDKKGYTDAILLALLTGLASGIIIGISIMVSNIVS